MDMAYGKLGLNFITREVIEMEIFVVFVNQIIVFRLRLLVILIKISSV